MRRVYTAYAANIVSSQTMLYSAMFMVALAVFAHLVHIHRLFENLFAQDISHIPQFILNAVLRGEVLTLMAIGVMIFTSLSIQWRLRGLFVTKMQAV